MLCLAENSARARCEVWAQTGAYGEEAKEKRRLDAAAVVIPPGLSPEMFTPMGMLALADELPVMIAYFDRDLRYRFLNKALADWLERPRSRDPRADAGGDHRRGGVHASASR